jgi:hypothetical protein
VTRKNDGKTKEDNNMPQLVTINEQDYATQSTSIELEWRERTIVFRRTSSSKTHTNAGIVALDGWQYGTLVAHATWDDKNAPPYTITHLPSKLMVARISDCDETLAQTERLWQSCPLAWAGYDVNKQLIPKEVVQWLKDHQR